MDATNKPTAMDVDEVPTEAGLDPVRAPIEVDASLEEDLVGLDEDDGEQKITLYVYKDDPSMVTGRTFEISRDATMNSVFFKTILEDKSETKIPVPVIGELSLEETENLLEFTVEYLEKMVVNPLDDDNLCMPIKTNVPRDNVKSSWECDLVEQKLLNFEDGVSMNGKKNLINLTLVANFLNIDPLLKLVCLHVACLIKGLPIDQIKDAIDPNLPLKAFEKASS